MNNPQIHLGVRRKLSRQPRNVGRKTNRSPERIPLGMTCRRDGIRVSGVSQKAYPVVIARRNDEAIQLLSVTSGLLHFVRNDESGLLRHPLRIGYGIFFYRHSGDVSKASILRHCEEVRRSNPVIINHFRIASLRSQ
jgi:hypothetical protein